MSGKEEISVKKRDEDDVIKACRLNYNLKKDPYFQPNSSIFREIVAAFTYYFGDCYRGKKKPSRQTAVNFAAKLGFYFIFYVIIIIPLAPIGFFYRHLRLDLNHPRYSQVILHEPGLNFRPYPVDGGRNKSWGTLVHFNRFDRSKFQQLIHSVDAIVNKYEAHIEPEKLREHQEVSWMKRCSFESPADDMHACILNTQGFGSYCYRNLEYGYPDGQPCFLIRVNKVHGWVPEPYQTFEELKTAGFPLDWTVDDFDPRYLPISCVGETKVDDELLGEVDYIYPFEKGKNGIPTYFFPYLNQINYKSPGMMVNFHDVQVSVVIRIKCQLWARNVRHDQASLGSRGRLRGGVHFELMVDNGIMETEVPPEEEYSNAEYHYESFIENTQNTED